MSDDNKSKAFDWNPVNDKPVFGTGANNLLSKTVPKAKVEKWEKPVTIAGVEIAQKTKKELLADPAVYAAQDVIIDANRSIDYHRDIEQAASMKKPVMGGALRFEEGLRQNEHLNNTTEADNVIIGNNPVGKSVSDWEAEGSLRSVAGSAMEENKPTIADRTEKFTD